MNRTKTKPANARKVRRPSTPPPKGFAERLQRLRLQKNLTQAELAERAQIHFTLVSRYERGITGPSAAALRRVADVLGVSADYLLDEQVTESARGCLEDKELLAQFEEIEKLSDDDKSVVKKFLDAFLCKKKIQELARG